VENNDGRDLTGGFKMNSHALRLYLEDVKKDNQELRVVKDHIKSLIESNKRIINEALAVINKVHSFKGVL
jgi:hypothetical protein